MPHAQRGITLIELISVVAVASVLGAIGLPPLQGLLERQRAIAAHNLVLASFGHARTHAMTARIDTVVCPSRDGQTCRNAPQWESGWLTFADRDRDGRKDADEPVLRSYEGTAEPILMRSSVNRTRARFRPDGRAVGSNLTLRICARDSTPHSALILNNSGRPRAGSAGELRVMPGC